MKPKHDPVIILEFDSVEPFVDFEKMDERDLEEYIETTIQQKFKYQRATEVTVHEMSLIANSYLRQWVICHPESLLELFELVVDITEDYPEEAVCAYLHLERKNRCWQ